MMPTERPSGQTFPERASGAVGWFEVPPPAVAVVPDHTTASGWTTD